MVHVRGHSQQEFTIYHVIVQSQASQAMAHASRFAQIFPGYGYKIHEKYMYTFRHLHSVPGQLTYACTSYIAGMHQWVAVYPDILSVSGRMCLRLAQMYSYPCLLVVLCRGLSACGCTCYIPCVYLVWCEARMQMLGEMVRMLQNLKTSIASSCQA